VNRRRNTLWWLLLLTALGGAMLVPRPARGGPLPQDTPPPTLPPAIWMTPVGGEAVPGIAGPNYFLLGGLGCLLLLVVAGAGGGAVYLARRRKQASTSAAPSVPPGYALVMRAGPGAGARYPITQATTVLGREPDCQVVVNHPAVAPHHARITWDGQQFVLQDLGSATGTFVNRYQINTPVLFRPGDVLSLGGAAELVLTQTQP